LNRSEVFRFADESARPMCCHFRIAPTAKSMMGNAIQNGAVSVP